MSTLETGWSTTATPPTVIVEHHMLLPGQTCRFALPGVEVTNLGDREAGLFLRGDGQILAGVPIGFAAETVQLELFSMGGVS